MTRLSLRLAASMQTLLIFAAISFRSLHAQPAAGGIIALSGARVIDGTGSAPVEQATILIANGRITAVGTIAAIKIPGVSTRIDMSGKTIMPGNHQRARSLECPLECPL